MTISRFSQGLMIGLTLFATLNLFAAEKASLTIYNPVSVGGKQLQAGDYTVRWDGDGPNVQLNILQGKSVVAAAPARLVDTKQRPDTNTYSVNTNPDGSKSLAQIQFHGKKFAVELDQAGTDVAGNNK